MSKNGCHTGISLQYIRSELGPWKICGKRNYKGSFCQGTLVEVYARYKDKGTIYKEHECTDCGKVVKDPVWIRDKEKRLADQPRKPYYKNQRRPHWQRNQEH